MYPWVIKHGNGKSLSLDDFSTRTSIYRGCLIAMFDYQSNHSRIPRSGNHQKQSRTMLGSGPKGSELELISFAIDSDISCPPSSFFLQAV